MSVFDPLSDPMLADPHAVYARLRRDTPVLWHERLNAWLVLRHEDCVRVMTDPKNFSNDLSVLGEDPPIEILGLQNMDSPEHNVIRRVLVRALRQVDLDRWVADCLEFGDKLLDQQDPDGFDFVTGFSQPLSAESMRILFGLPDFGDPDAFHAAQRALVFSMDTGLDPVRGAPGVAARDYLSGVLDPWLAAPPASGLLRYVDVEAAGPLRRYLVNSLRQILVAGFLSSSSMLACAMQTLTNRELLAGPAALPMSITSYHELVRHSGAVQVDGRACTRNVVVGGTAVRRGDEVLTVLAAANRDPAVFDRPDELVLDRTPNPHLGFGRGSHACLGTNLSLALHVPLLARLSERYRVRMAGQPRVRRTGTLRGFDHLPLSIRHR